MKKLEEEAKKIKLEFSYVKEECDIQKKKAYEEVQLIKLEQ